MIYMWFTGINYYKLAVEKDGDSIFTTIRHYHHMKTRLKQESCVHVGKHYPGHQDLACQQARSRYTEKRFVSCERSVTFHIIFTSRQDCACKLVKKFSC